MPDDPKTALPGQEDGSAAAAATATPAESTSDAETAEQKIARLERERDEAIAKAENERRLNLSHREKVEEANRLMAEGRNATDDPLDAEIAALQQAQQVFAANNQSDPATNAILNMKLREREQRRIENQQAARYRQAQADMEAVPSQYRERTWKLWTSGQYWTVAAALQAAKGEEADELRKRLEERDLNEKKREAEILARQAAAPGSPRGGGGGGPTTPNKMPLSDYIAKVNALRAAGDHAGAAKLTREKDEGKVSLDYNA